MNDGFPYSYTLTNLLPGEPDTVVNPGGRVPPAGLVPAPARSQSPQHRVGERGCLRVRDRAADVPGRPEQGSLYRIPRCLQLGGTANEENPLLFADTSTGKYFDFVSNDEPNIGHFDGASSIADSLYLSDVASTGQVFGSPGTGVIYQIKSLGLPPTDGWQGYALDPQHTALSPVASQPLGSILWQAPVDLHPQYNGNDLLIHYGSPLVTASNTVIIPVKTGTTERVRGPGTLGVKWRRAVDVDLGLPCSQPSGYNWIPSYSPTLTPSNRLYFAGNGGTVMYTDSPDAAGPNPPATGRLAFFGLANYNANPAAYNSTVFINTPITSDSAGNIYFGFIVTGSNPSGADQRNRADRRRAAPEAGPPVVSGTSQVATNSAPALSNDGTTLYVLESTGNFGSGKLVALNSHTLAVLAQVTLKDPHNRRKRLDHQRRHGFAHGRARRRRLYRRARESVRVEP